RMSGPRRAREVLRAGGDERNELGEHDVRRPDAGDAHPIPTAVALRGDLVKPLAECVRVGRPRGVSLIEREVEGAARAFAVAQAEGGVAGGYDRVLNARLECRLQD